MPVRQLPRPPSRDEHIMLKNVPIMLCCTAPKCSSYAQTMLIKCDPHSENQPPGLFHWVVCQVIVISLQNGVYQLIHARGGAEGMYDYYISYYIYDHYHGVR